MILENGLQHDTNWNPWLGCRKISPACKNCLMFITQGSRFVNFGRKPEHDPANIHRAKTTWLKPRRMQRLAEKLGRTYYSYVCGYSDFFLEEADPWRAEAWALMKTTPSVIYQIQTKRTERIVDHLPEDWGSGYTNVWLGAGVETNAQRYRLDHLRAVPCVMRYADNVGMLEDVTPGLNLDGIGWVVAGGEGGYDTVEPRPYNLQCGRNVRDLCAQLGIPFFFYQVGGRARKQSRLLDGVEHRHLPEVTSVCTVVTCTAPESS